jgi:pyruvate dehydrogenase E2 component (dihydrolipoamide acetyltransferase)
MAEFFTMPAASPTMEVGRLVGWLVKEGDEVSFGTVMAEVETDKATAEIESFEDSIVLKILRQAGDDVPVGTPIAIVGESSEEDISDLLEQFKAGVSTTATSEPAPEPKTEKIKVGPAARIAAQEHGINLSNVQGTGPGGRIMSEDIKNFSKSNQAAAVAGQEGSITYFKWDNKTINESIMETPIDFVPNNAHPKRRGKGTSNQSGGSQSIANSMMRKTIARRLKESYLDAPTFFLNAKFNCDQLFVFRSQLKEAGVKVSYNDLVIKAVAKALKDVPAVNSSWTEDAIIQHGDVHIGMAVALPDGLITPVIRNTDTKGLETIATETKELAVRARDRKLQPEEYQNSTFTISNLGMMKIEHFTAIINPPNSAILAVGSLQQEPIITNGQLGIGWRMKVTMTCDHRVVDGALGAEFLLAVRKYIECPALLAT